MTFKTFITDANSLGVAIDRLGAVTKTNYALYGKALEGLSARQVALALSTKKLSAAELEEIVKVNHLIEKYGAEELIKVELLSANSALLASERAISIERARELLQKAGIEEKDAEMLISKHLSIVADGEEATAKQVLIKELLDEAVTKELVTSGNAKEILSSQGVILNDIKETASKKALTTALRKEASARIISISKYALLAASIYAVYKAHDYLVTTLNETEQKFNNQKSKLEEYQSELDSTSEKLSETKDKLNELNNLKINGEITTVQLEELSTLKQQTAEYQAQYDLILAKTEAQKIAAQASASELISLQKEYEKLQNSPWLKYSEKVFSVTQYNPYAAGGFTKGLEWLTSAFGKKENKVSKFFGGVNDWTSGRTLFEMATGIDTEGVKNYKTAEEYLEKYKKLQGELNDLYKKSESESLTVKESKRLLKLKEELGNVSPKLLDEYNNNLSVLELYKSDEHSKKIFEDAIKELEDKNKAIMYTLNSIDLENSSEDDIRDYVKYKLSESGITDEELIDSISKSADTYKVAAKMFKEGVSVEDIVSYINPKDDLIDKLIPKKDELSAGIGFILQNAISQVDSNIVTNWINGLSDEDARIANSDKFDQELEKQKEKLNGATLSAKDYYEVLQRVKDSLNKEDVNVTSYVSFIDAFNSSDFAETKEKLLDLAKSGELTPETLSSTEDYKKLIDETGLSAQYCCERIYDLVTAHGKLANITSGLSSLTNLYKQANENGYVDINDILKLDDTWKDLSSYEEFVDIIGSGTHSMSEIQDAFDKLTSEYLTHNNALNKLNESNKDLYINQLKNAGISNAQAIVEKKLANQYIADMSTYEGLTQANKDLYVEKLKNKDIANAEQIVQKVLDAEYITQTDALNGLTEANKAEYEAKLKAEGVTNANTIITNKLRAEKEAEETVTEKLNMTMNEFNSKSYEVQNSLLDEANASTLCRNEIVELQLAEIKYNNQGLDVTGKINQLKDLAIAYGIANTKAQEMAEREQQMRDYESRTGANTGFKYTEADWKHAEEDLRKQIDASFANLGDNSYTIDIKYDGGTDYQKELADKQEKNAEKSEQIFDWIERKVNNLTKSLNDLKDASDDTYSSWTNRNTALTKAIDTTRQAIELQQQAYSRYMQQAESVGLPDIYKNLIKNGALDISIITDDDLKDKISDYQEWYDKAQDCLDVQKDLMDSLNELNSKKFDNIQSIFEFDKSNIEHSLTMLNNQIDKLEMKGLFANEGYYNQMLQYTQKEINSLTNERTQLANVMNSSALSQDSEAWQEMYSTLTQIDEEILELNNDLIEFNNSIRDLNWEIFEYLEESINRITDETEYLADLLSNEDLYDDNGNLTKYADATIGLYATAYDTYRQQAKDYYEEVQDLQKKLVNGAGKDVLEQYYKMVDAHQEAVKSANQEKQAILDLISDGYQKQIDYLNEIINKKKESLNAEKDLFNYTKSIEEKSKTISSLQKQYDIYKNDMSEEGMAQAQKIKVQLETAQQDLEKTEYEQYLRDQEEMLDMLSTDFEDFLNNRLDNEDALLSEIVGTVSGKGDEINSTLNEVADKYGTMISDSITSIFDAKSPFTNTLSNGITTINNSIAGTTSAIDRLIAQVANITNANASKTNAGSGTNGGSSNPPSNTNKSNNTNPSSNAGNNNSNNTPSSNSSNNSAWGSWFIRKTDSYPKNKLDIQNSIVDRLKYNSIDSSFSARSKYYSAMGGSGTYTGSASQNTWMLNQLKSHGYAKGSKRIPYDQIALLGEEGNELQFDISEGVLREVGEGDKIFTNEASKVLWDFSKNPSEFIEKFGLANLTPQFNFVTPTLPPIARNNASNSVNMNVDGIEINLPNVTNYKEFRNELIKDSNFTNAMGTYVNNKIMGKNSLEHLKYAK